MKHHYVPACYLRSFVDPACPADYKPYVWVVDLDSGRIRAQSPRNTAHRTDYYAVGEGANRYEVERYFAQVESEAAPVLSKMQGDYHVVDAEDKRILSHFAALQIVRVPQFRDRIEAFIGGVAEVLSNLMLQSRARYEAELRQALPERDFSTEEVDRLFEGACDTKSYRLVANPEAALGHGLRVVPRIADLLNRMSWALMEPSGAKNYWTSDNPLFYINPEAKHPLIGHGLGAKNIEVNLPIGPRRCLLMAWSDVAGPRAALDNVRIAQERGIVAARRYLFCSTEADAYEAYEAHRRLFPDRRSDAAPKVQSL